MVNLPVKEIPPNVNHFESTIVNYIMISIKNVEDWSRTIITVEANTEQVSFSEAHMYLHGTVMYTMH